MNVNDSATLQKRDIDTFKLLGELNITENNQAIDQLNELEYVDNVIYANIWQTNDIIKIDANSGEVLQRYNLTSMLKELPLTEYQRTNMDVLNGIAHIEKNRFYITGKLYPVVLEVELSEYILGLLPDFNTVNFVFIGADNKGNIRGLL